MQTLRRLLHHSNDNLLWPQVREVAWRKLKFTKDEPLGAGTFGVVKRATLQGKPVAVKMVNISKEERERFMTHDQFYHEALLLLRMAPHPNIIKLVGVSKESDTQWAFVLELAERGSLDKYLKQKEQLSLADKWHMAMQIADALRYLHGQDKPIVHRDLKPANILVMSDGTVRITDFGTARPLDATSLATQLMGTPGYIPPDTNEKQTEKFDVYSFGVVLWQLLTHEKALPSMEHEAMKRLGRPWQELVGSCLHDEPEARPSFAAIYQRLAGLFPLPLPHDEFEGYHYYLERVKNLLERKETCRQAASSGHLEVLQWLRANGCPWDEETCSEAASRGHIEVLQWARANGCPWDEETCSEAARVGQEVLQWASANGCPRKEKNGADEEEADEPKRALKGHSQFVSDVVISSDGQFALSGVTLSSWGDISRQRSSSEQKEKDLDNDEPRKIACYGMEREYLADIIIEPTDLIGHVAAKVKAALHDMLNGRPFRLRRGEEGWKRKSVPIIKLQFGLRAFDVFPDPGDFVVVQFGQQR